MMQMLNYRLAVLINFQCVIDQIKQWFGLVFVLSVVLAGCSTPTPIRVEPKDSIADIIENTSRYPARLASSLLRVAPTGTSPPIQDLQPASFSSLSGWTQAMPRESWSAFRQSCNRLKTNPIWEPVCRFAQEYPELHPDDIRSFFEQNFALYSLKNPNNKPGLLTGYYEPILKGSLFRDGIYQYPLYAMPEHWKRQANLPTAGQIYANNLLRGHELIYLADPVEVAFVHIQGSALVQLQHGQLMRISYAGNNGKTFASMASWLNKTEGVPMAQLSMEGIKVWAKANPEKVPALLASNPRFIFFSAKMLSNSDQVLRGPIGSLGVPLTPHHSVAVDPSWVPMGTPLWIESSLPVIDLTIRQLVMAQDTGNAIKGAVRMDYFWGTGENAGRYAGVTKNPLVAWILWPK